ncbi:phytanoyl-CoA dioxygenase family protein [Kamptonema cortianum]|nr:phytanoyl-CoA dioxygenase family protein [Oscillatoria laete-virens]MDK3159928.1 phytanoyl-CoA dioxygenase family protein [Kamptonema cortianum]MDL5055516.1 phytanoyl-CoA dioxygenase family protein [Oscillatoria laete-virens NRMC-F 0139]
MTIHTTPDVLAALNEIEKEKSGKLPPFLSPDELATLVAAWHRIYNDPDCEIDPRNPRFIVHPKIYSAPEFIHLITHPVIQEAVRRCIGEFEFAGYSVVATPRNGDRPTPFERIPFHIDHVYYSDVPPEDTRDTFCCVWMNFEEQAPENGPICLAHGTHKFRIGGDFFKKRPGLRLQDLGGVEKVTMLNTGPAGTTAVYSGLTWHSPTTNCSEVIRKGLNMNFVPKNALDTRRRNRIDVSGLPKDQYDAFVRSVGVPGYVTPWVPELQAQDRHTLPAV